MSWRKEQRRAERGYHHGNLKEALLQAALGLIAEKGAAGFTFADAGRLLDSLTGQVLPACRPAPSSAEPTTLPLFTCYRETFPQSR
jgi:hypothetical protein